MAKRFGWPMSGVMEMLAEKLKWIGKWHKFVEVEQVCVGDHWDVKKEHEFFGHRVVEV
jgi:hypothetical protein